MYSSKNRYAIIILLSVYSFLNVLTVEVFTYYPIQIPKIVLLGLFAAIIFLIWEANRILELAFPSQQFDKQQLISYLYKNFLGSIIITVIITVSLGIIVSYFLTGLSFEKLFLPLKLLVMFAFRINLFLNVVNIIFKYISQLEKAQSEAEKFKKISAQAQLQAIKNQINPHFLFNNLNVLSALIAKNSDTSIEFVNQFAKVYRYVLKSHEKEIIELDAELNFIESYAYLMKKRFGTGLVINIKVDEEVRNFYVVPMAMQMLIENAIKHNSTSKSQPLTIEIYNDSLDNLIIRNNLQIKQVDIQDSTQIGLANISQRYKFFGEYEIVIFKTNEFFTVKIPLINLPNQSVEEFSKDAFAA
jgi:two-component system, LytTR family, sensor kinase